MTDQQLAAILAERVMGWTVRPERYLIGGRRWLPRWRFQPASRLADAFRLLEHTNPEDYAIGIVTVGFHVRVCIASVTGEAVDLSHPRAISLAVARALGLEV